MTRYDALEVDDKGKAAIELFKEAAEGLAQILDTCGKSRQAALALTHLEDCVMHGTRAIAEIGQVERIATGR